ncbi:MAG: helix-turn-helix transcriptional regulator [Thermoplasmatales archaeon]|nr:helix-turn-helix transcriptional regulator [Thermoplasmatales archaeon]MCW6169662.1 helix-turn-helix transcriptional regulator [Thermoplasmatales archaeon]
MVSTSQSPLPDGNGLIEKNKMNGYILPIELASLSSNIHSEIHVLNDRWTLPIIFLLEKEKRMRFSQIKRSLRGIGGRSLSRALTSLESVYLIDRTVTDSNPPAVYYSLSTKGVSLVPILLELFEWKDRLESKPYPATEEIVIKEPTHIKKESVTR